MRRTGFLACLPGLVLGAVISGHEAALAESDQQPLPSEQTPTITGITGESSDEPEPPRSEKVAAPVLFTDPYQRFDALGVKGWFTPFPSVSDSILGDVGGIRSALADAGLGFYAFFSGALTYNLLQNAGHAPKLVNGQDLTFAPLSPQVGLTYDLGRVGLDDGQLVFDFHADFNNFEAANGPHNARFTNAYYYQSLFDNLLEVKLGYTINVNDFIGINVAGSVTSGALGPQSVIPIQVGLSFGPFGAPTASVKVNYSDEFYSRSAIQRSLSPDGLVAEEDQNETGLRFSVPGAGPLFINEVGYKVLPGPGQKSFWLRAGGINNSSDYTSFVDGREIGNWATYALADFQITQPDQALPFRGLYLGASYNYAPPEQNLFSQYLEARIYAVGPFDSRPFDLVSLVATHNGYSQDALDLLTAPGEGNFAATETVIASYAYRVSPGFYIQPGLGLFIHPTYSPRLPPALNGYLAVTLLF